MKSKYLVTAVLLLLIYISEQNIEVEVEVEVVEKEGVLLLETSKTLRNSLFLHAVSSVLHAGKDAVIVDDIVFNYLKEASVDVVVIYCRLNAKQQLVVHQSLCLIIHSLSSVQRLISGDSSNNTSSIGSGGSSSSGSIVINSAKSGNNSSSGDNSDSNTSLLSLLSEYLDEIIPTILLRTISRKVDGEEMFVDPSFILILAEKTGVCVCFTVCMCIFVRCFCEGGRECV